jgi:hypothetical protein
MGEYIKPPLTRLRGFGLPESTVQEIADQLRLGKARRACQAFNDAMGMHGVGIAQGRGCALIYANTGDTYGTTLVVVKQGPQRFAYVGSWGDFVERNPNLFPE